MAKQGIPEKKGKVEEKSKREGYEKKSKPFVPALDNPPRNMQRPEHSR